MSSATTAEGMNARQRDAGLVASARRGDVAAFEALMDRHLDRGYRIASVLLGASEADAAVADAALAAWRQLPRLSDVGEFGAWFDAILVGACRMRVRGSDSARGHVTPVTPGETSPAGSSAADGIGFEEAIARLDRAFDRLDATDRTVLVLHEVARDTPAQIAATVHEPVGVIRVRLAEAMSTLLRSLEAEP